jgi:hypothetical protein
MIGVDTEVPPNPDQVEGDPRQEAPPLPPSEKHTT